MEKSELLGIITRAIVEDDSLETGEVRPFGQEGLLIEVTPADGESVFSAVSRARDLMVDALNGDDMPETGKTVALGEQRFLLTIFDAEEWLGTVAAYCETYQNQLASYWPGRPADAPGQVFALRLSKLKNRGGVSTALGGG
jgi:hypothetical protein